MRVDRITEFSRGYPPRLAQLSDSIYVHRFCEDVRLQMLPSRPARRDPHIFEIMPWNRDLIRKTLTLFAEPYEIDWNTSINRRTEVADVITEFIIHVASDLATKGVSFWEIAKVCGDENTENVLPALVWISGEVKEQRHSIRQRIARRKESSSKESLIDLPKSKVAIFRLPEGLGTPREHLHRMEVLEQASTITPGFYSEIVGAESNELGFQFGDFTSAQFRAVAKAMRSWGWLSPVQALEYVTEFYSVIRQLQFHQVMARLRCQIVSEMNAILDQEGIETKIVVNGLLTADEIGDLITGVRDGSTSFDQAMAPIQSQLLN